MSDSCRPPKNLIIASLDHLAKCLVISLLLGSLYTVLSGWSYAAEYPLQINSAEPSVVTLKVLTDDFPEELRWQLVNGNNLEVLFSTTDSTLRPNTLYTDTIMVGMGTCLYFEIADNSGDGFGPGGFYEVVFNDVLVAASDDFTASERHVFNCSEGQTCETAIPIFDGSELLKEEEFTWFVVHPDEDTYFDIRTISDCDTEMWVYDDCLRVHPSDQTGAIIYNDDKFDLQAGFNQILFASEVEYFIRVRRADDCPGDIYFYIVNLKLKKGCLDPLACNFDPLANLDGENCIHNNCQPDLRINSEVFRSSIYLDSIFNDSECLVPEGCLQGYGMRDIIRFSTQIDNIGNADYIVGPPEEESPLFSEDNCHQHWHYLGYAEYLLFDENGAPRPVGFKNGFCALDYSCDETSSYKYDCNYMGISAGCTDIYEHDLICQWIDVTEVADGEYTLVVRVNYNQLPDVFGRVESDFDNNWSQVCIRLDRTEGKLKLEIIDNCAEYTDCMGMRYGATMVDCEGVCGGVAHYGDVNEDGELNEGDLTAYALLIQDDQTSIEPCFDLDKDSVLTLGDMLLANSCLRNNPDLENNLLHSHCEFPISIVNTQDSFWLEIEANPINSEELLLYYRANEPIKGLDIRMDHIEISSIELFINETSVHSYNSTARIAFYYEDESAGMPKTTIREHFATIKFDPGNVEEICLGQPYYVFNFQNEKMNTIGTGQCLDLRTTSAHPAFENDVKIFPNPAATHLTIDLSDEFENVEFQFYNTTGKFVFAFSQVKGNGASIDISGLLAGVYIVRFKLGTRIMYERFLKL